MEIRIPVLAPSNRREFERDVRKLALPALRKWATRQRKTLPKLTGDLRKSFRFTGRVTRRIVGRFVTVAELKYKYWLLFQRRDWDRIRADLRDEGPPIIRDAVVEALRRQGFR